MRRKDKLRRLVITSGVIALIILGFSGVVFVEGWRKMVCDIGGLSVFLIVLTIYMKETVYNGKKK